jgi:hypothetical protein
VCRYSDDSSDDGSDGEGPEKQWIAMVKPKGLHADEDV